MLSRSSCCFWGMTNKRAAPEYPHFSHFKTLQEETSGTNRRKFLTHFTIVLFPVTLLTEEAYAFLLTIIAFNYLTSILLPLLVWQNESDGDNLSNSE